MNEDFEIYVMYIKAIKAKLLILVYSTKKA